jgi:hypothetical protein
MFQKVAILMTVYRDVSADEMVRAIYIATKSGGRKLSFQHLCWKLLELAKKEVKPFHKALQTVAL